MWKKLTISGVISSVVYAIHVILGGILWNDYSHLNNAISDLTGANAPNRELLTYITSVYAVFAIIFIISTLMYTKNYLPKITRVGFTLFLFMHIISASYGFFPVDPIGSQITFLGTMHIVITALIVPLTIISPLLIGIGLRKIPKFKNYGTYSIITSIIIFLAGGLSVLFAVNKLPYFGLVERINIGSLQFWMFLISLRLFKSDFSAEK